MAKENTLDQKPVHQPRVRRRCIIQPSNSIQHSYREFYKHQKSMSELVQAFEKLRISSFTLDEQPQDISKATLNNLPQEILLNIVKHFAEPWVLTDEIADWTIYNLDRESKERQRALVSLCKTSRLISAAATTILYHCAHLPSTKSVRYFLRALRMRQDLSSLVKQVSCPHYVLMRLSYIFAPDTFDHNTKRLSWWGNRIPRVQRLSKKLLLDRRNIIGYQDLFEILYYVPHVRTLSIPRAELGLVTGPWGSGLVRLEHLTKLSISIHFQPSSRLRSNDTGQVLHWLDPETIKATCPSLKYLELLSPYGEWRAEFTELSLKRPGKRWTSHQAGKYIESLSIVSRNGGGCLQWDLMTLQQPVFDPSCFHTLHFASPPPKHHQLLQFAQEHQWNLNTFLHTRGKRVRVLTLDWDTDCFPHVMNMLFGPVRHITNLNELTNLTHLTISLQVLYTLPLNFVHQVVDLADPDPVSEINQLLPRSLKVLRINEYMPAVFFPPNRPQMYYESKFALFSESVALLISKLRRHWLYSQGDRELWFKRYRALDDYDDSLRRLRGGPRTRGRQYLVDATPPRDRDVTRDFVKLIKCRPGGCGSPLCPALANNNSSSVASG